MPSLHLSGLPTTHGHYAPFAAAIPGALVAKKDLAGAAAALNHLADAAHTGLLSVSNRDHTPDPLANLWFIHAAHIFAQAGGDPALVAKYLPLAKRIVQKFITAKGVHDVTMDDGGLLVAPDLHPSQSLRLNALWYSALESTATDLRRAKDHTGDHFERLAGRFRRAFAKFFWCEIHNCVCPPYVRPAEPHGDYPDPDQLLLTVLPASPIPRTKQRQLLQAIRNKSLDATTENPAGTSIGVIFEHPKLGRIESPLHRAWLALGFWYAADNRAAALPEARAILEPLHPLLAAADDGGIVPYYKDGHPIPGQSPDPLTTAEVIGAFHQLNAAP